MMQVLWYQVVWTFCGAMSRIKLN